MKRFLILICLISVMSCKVKDVVVDKSKEKTIETVDNATKIDNESTVVVNDSTFKAETAQIIDVLKTLDIKYDGKELEDKLDVLLKQSEKGTKVTFSGKGQVSYKEDYSEQFKTFEETLIKRQDSIIKQAIDEMVKKNEFLLEEQFNKIKNVKVKNLPAGAYITIVVIIFGILILRWLGKKLDWF